MISLNTAGADRAEMPDRAADRREIRLRAFEIGWISSHQQRQLAGGRRLRQAGDRTIDVDQAAAVELARHLERVLVRDRGAFDRERAGFHVGGSAVLGQPDRA
ncbi:hypothetical protein AB7M49_007209 [Bradyrhizobium elkanii]